MSLATIWLSSTLLAPHRVFHIHGGEENTLAGKLTVEVCLRTPPLPRYWLRKPWGVKTWDLAWVGAPVFLDVPTEQPVLGQIPPVDQEGTNLVSSDPSHVDGTSFHISAKQGASEAAPG